MQGSGPAATEKAILKEEASIVNGRGNCRKEKGIHCYCFLICHVPHGMGSHSLATWIAREEKNSFIFLSCPGLSQNIISGDPTGTSTFLVHFQEAGTKGSKLYRTGGKHNISLKAERFFFFFKTKSLINDVDPWLNNIWERKLYFILAAVTTGGWNSGHLPNHLELLYDWQSTISYCTWQL